MSDVAIEIKGKYIVATPGNDQATTAVKSVLSSRFDGRAGGWVLPATPHGALELAGALRGRSVDVAEEVRQLAAEARAGMAATQYKTLPHPEPIPGLKTRSWEHQGQGFEFAKHNRATMLAMDMGTGKSLVVAGLAEHDETKIALIVCPRNCLGVWLREFKMHPDRRWEVFTGKVPKKGGGFIRTATVARKTRAAEAAIDRAKITGTPLAIVVNYEAFTQPAMAQLIREQQWDLIAFDESHRIQDPGGKWSKFAATLDAPRKVCCTGTPFGQTPLTIYAQYRFLDPGIFGTDYALFKARYGVVRTIEIVDKRGRPRQQEILVGIRKDMEADFMERFNRIAFVCKSDDVQDLPECVPSVRDVELEPATCAIYDELDAEYIAWVNGDLEGEPVTAANALVKSLRLQQIVNGYAKDEGGVLQRVGDEKMKALRELLVDTDKREPVVVFCRFVEDLNRIQKVAEESGRRYGELSGRRKDALTEHATMRDDIDLAAVQLQSGGVGIDLTRARIAIYYSLCDSLIQYQQSRKRIHRPGQERSSVLIHLLTDTPVERKIYRALARNEQINEALLRAAREGWDTEID
jgi:SNF2 family DNA or RNA helicase